MVLWEYEAHGKVILPLVLPWHWEDLFSCYREATRPCLRLHSSLTPRSTLSEVCCFLSHWGNLGHWRAHVKPVRICPCKPMKMRLRWCAMGSRRQDSVSQQILLFLLWGTGMPLRLGCHLCSPSRAQQAAEQRANRNTWETDILGFGNFSNAAQQFR